VPDNKTDLIAQDQKDKKDKTDKTDKDKTDKTDKVDKDKTEKTDKEKEDKDQKQPEKKFGETFVPKNVPEPEDTVAYAPASMKEEPIGKLVPSPVRKAKDTIVQLADTAAVLLRKTDKDWVRVGGKGVKSGRSLVSLPGSKSVIALDKGVEVTLWGNLPELTLDYMVEPVEHRYYTVLESRATLHVPASPFDADITLERGRTILRNRKEGGKDALVRVRFIDSMQPREMSKEKGKDNDKDKEPEYDQGKAEYFDLELHAGSSVVLERNGFNLPNEPFQEDRKAARVGPIAIVRVYAFENAARVKSGSVEWTVSAKQTPILQWISGTAQLGRIDTPPPAMPWLGIQELKDKKGGATAYREKCVQAHLGLAKDLDGPKALDVVIAETKNAAQKATPANKPPSLETVALWQHAIRCSAAVDHLDALYRDFAAADTSPIARLMCRGALQNWLGWGYDSDYEMLAVVQKQQGNKRIVAEKIMKLFHPLPEEERQKPLAIDGLVEGLTNPSLAIRVLSHWHLSALYPAGGEIPYDPSPTFMSDAGRRAAADAWMKLIHTPPKKKTTP
jgi:hypothetical protein